MLHAPLTITTAKLDINLLLESSPSPPPPSSSSAEARGGYVSRSTTQPPTSAPYVASRHRSSSSTQSASVSYFASAPSQALRPQRERPRLPSISSTSFFAPTLSPPSIPQQGFQPALSAPGHRQPPPMSPIHNPAKRPPPAAPHPAASPAKKQSKWTRDEDALIIELRGSGMKWEDISKRLPGRTAISCRLHYQNYLERRSEWDEERKNRLARLYDRLKSEMWAPLAAELSVPWRAAEAMHWQLGEAEMARRAGSTPFALASASGSAPPIQAHMGLPQPGPYPPAGPYQPAYGPGMASQPSTPGTASQGRLSYIPEEIPMGPGTGSRARSISRGSIHSIRGSFNPVGQGGVSLLAGAGPVETGLGTGPSTPGALPSLAELDMAITAYDDNEMRRRISTNERGSRN